MTRYLLDTHVVYRWMRDDRKLGRTTRNLIAKADCSVSTASLWEMVIKNVRGKLPLPDGPLADAMEAQGFRVLAISANHIEATRRFAQVLPDPFDSLLLAVADTEGALLLTQDSAILDAATRFRLPVADVNG